MTQTEPTAPQPQPSSNVGADQHEAPATGRHGLDERALQLHEALLHWASGITAVVSAEAEILYASPGVKDLLGYEVDQLFGETGFAFTHPDDEPLAQGALVETLRSPREPVYTEFRVRHADGTYRMLGITLTNFLDQPEIGGIVANVHDRTEQHEMKAALVATEERFRLMVQYSSDIIVVFDDSLNITYISPAVTEQLGYQPEEVESSRVVDYVDPTHLERVAAGVERAIAGGPEEPVELRIRHADGSWRWFEARGHSLIDDPLINGIVVNLRDISERKQHEAELRRRALHDTLTGLPNRALLEDRLTHALGRSERLGRSCALLFLDLDQFKLVNDSAGHAAGDMVLVEVARRLAESVRPGDTVARFGGDEFAVLCEDLESDEAALTVASRIHAELAPTFRVADRDMPISASIGVVVAGEDHTAAAMVQSADTAMYAAKRYGGGRTETFAESLRAQVVSRVDLLARLQRAIATDELYVEYQPIVDRRTRQIVGVEALVRWHQPELGQVPPAEFIPLAEESGLIDQLGGRVLRECAARLAVWNDLAPDLFVAYNASSRQLSNPDFVSEIVAVAAAEGVDLGRIVVELTEQTLLRGDEASVWNLKELERLGIRMAIDDFGTGYSSLAYLQELPVDFLKIDGSFIRNLGSNERDRSLVEAVCKLGEAFGLVVIAEHVDDEAQMDVLSETHCELVQGHLFSRSVGHREIEQLLRDR